MQGTKEHWYNFHSTNICCNTVFPPSEKIEYHPHNICDDLSRFDQRGHGSSDVNYFRRFRYQRCRVSLYERGVSNDFNGVERWEFFIFLRKRNRRQISRNDLGSRLSYVLTEKRRKARRISDEIARKTDDFVGPASGSIFVCPKNCKSIHQKLTLKYHLRFVNSIKLACEHSVTIYCKLS